MPSKPRSLAKDIVVQVYRKPKAQKGSTGGAYVKSARITREPRSDASDAAAGAARAKNASAKKPAANPPKK